MDLDFFVFSLLHPKVCNPSTLSNIFYFISDKSHLIWFIFIFLLALFRGKKEYYPFFVCIGGFFVAWHLNDELIKPLFDRVRPFMAHKGVCIFGEAPHSVNSFPSGHTLTAFAMATLIYLYNQKNIPLQVLAIAFALFNGYLRIFLGVHYPTDVLAGALFGTGFGWVWYTAVEWTRKNYQAK